MNEAIQIAFIATTTAAGILILAYLAGCIGWAVLATIEALDNPAEHKEIDTGGQQ